jgi:hypothetical protein
VRWPGPTVRARRAAVESSQSRFQMSYSNKERLYDRSVNLIASLQRETKDWFRTSKLIELLSDLVPAAEGGELEYWGNSPLSHRLADAVITKLKCPPIADETHASIVEMTAEWTQEDSGLKEWHDQQRSGPSH